MQAANLLLPILIVGVGYLFFIRPQRARQHAAAEMRRQVQPGVRIMTTAGLYATVVALEHDEERGEDLIVLETAPGVTSRWARAAVGRVFADDVDAEADDELHDDELHDNDLHDDDLHDDELRDDELHEDKLHEDKLREEKVDGGVADLTKTTRGATRLTGAADSAGSPIAPPGRD